RRIADLIPEIENSSEIAFLQVMTSPAPPMQYRMQIWAATDQMEQKIITDRPGLLNRSAPMWRPLVYDRVMPILARQFAQHELSTQMTVDQAFPPPPNLEVARQIVQQRALEFQRLQEE